MDHLTPDTVRMLIDMWKQQCVDGELTASPPSLALALGLEEEGELEELSKRKDLRTLIKQAILWMRSEWYKDLRKSNKEVTASGIQFGLKSMGTTDTKGKGVQKGQLHVHIYNGHEKL